MIDGWWLVAEALFFLAGIILLNHQAYRHGIWDGAFNHFLPIVRQEMLFYDERRARDIFAAEEVQLMASSINEEGSETLFAKQIANGNRDENGRWIRDAEEHECGDCGLPIGCDDQVCPHCGAQ